MFVLKVLESENQIFIYFLTAVIVEQNVDVTYD